MAPWEKMGVCCLAGSDMLQEVFHNECFFYLSHQWEREDSSGTSDTNIPGVLY